MWAHYKTNFYWHAFERGRDKTLCRVLIEKEKLSPKFSNPMIEPIQGDGPICQKCWNELGSRKMGEKNLQKIRNYENARTDENIVLV